MENPVGMLGAPYQEGSGLFLGSPVTFLSVVFVKQGTKHTHLGLASSGCCAPMVHLLSLIILCLYLYLFVSSDSSNYVFSLKEADAAFLQAFILMTLKLGPFN